MSDASTQLGSLGVAVVGAAEALAEDLGAGTTFAQRPLTSDGRLFPSPLSLSGSSTVQLVLSSVALAA